MIAITAASKYPGAPRTPKIPRHPNELTITAAQKFAAMIPAANPSCWIAIALARSYGPYISAISDTDAGAHPASPNPTPTRRIMRSREDVASALSDVSVLHTRSDVTRSILRPYMSATRASGIVATAYMSTNAAPLSIPPPRSVM